MGEQIALVRAQPFALMAQQHARYHDAVNRRRLRIGLRLPRRQRVPCVQVPAPRGLRRRRHRLRDPPKRSVEALPFDESLASAAVPTYNLLVSQPNGGPEGAAALSGRSNVVRELGLLYLVVFFHGLSHPAVIGNRNCRTSRTSSNSLSGV